jgi:hypothetical protein
MSAICVALTGFGQGWSWLRLVLKLAVIINACLVLPGEHLSTIDGRRPGAGRWLAGMQVICGARVLIVAGGARGGATT